MLKTYLKVFCLCLVVLFISDSLTAQTFGSVKKKTRDTGNDDPCEDGTVELVIELLLDDMPPNYSNPQIGISGHGPPTFAPLTQNDLDGGSTDISISVSVGSLPCIDGKKTLKISLDLYDSRSGQMISSSDMGDDQSITASVPLCDCDGNPNPGDPLPSTWGTGRASGKIGDLNVSVSQTFHEITVSGEPNEEFKPELQIVNLNGQLIKTVKKQETSLISFELADLQKGYYIIHGMINNKPYSRSFIKM